MQQAYDFASARVMDHVMKKANVRHLQSEGAGSSHSPFFIMWLAWRQFMGRLRSIKMYFLLHVGAFLNDFMDLAEAELAKPAKDIVLTRLQHLLELSVRTSAAASDPFKVRAWCPQPAPRLPAHSRLWTGQPIVHSGDLHAHSPP